MQRKIILIFVAVFGMMGLAWTSVELKDLKPLYKAQHILIVGAMRERSLGKISKGDADYAKIMAAMRRLRPCPLQKLTSDIILRFPMDNETIYIMRYDAKKHYLGTGGIDTPLKREPFNPPKAWKTTPEFERILDRHMRK